MIMDGFVLGPGPLGRCDELRIGGGVVDYDPQNGVWRLWYYCRDRPLHEHAPKTLGSGRVALATSANGIDWSRYDGPLTGGAIFEPAADPLAFDSLHLAVTDVTRGKDGWSMWYFGGDRTERHTTSALGAVSGLGLRIGVARSVDGINWTRIRGPEPSGALIDYTAEQTYVAWANVFGDGRRLFMQYTAPDRALDQYSTLTAVSDDGLRWTTLGPLQWLDGVRPWDSTGIITRQVLENPLPVGGRFLMIYTGTDERHARAIGAASSDDGVGWTHLYEQPIFHVGAHGAWDSLGVAATRLVPVEGRLHLYYYGFQSLGDNDLPRGLGLAISDDGDLQNLVRLKR
jgi:hypothetical protein